MNTDSILVKTFIEADRFRRAALADGASHEDANAIVATALREAWPRGREEPWRYNCEACEDSGWRPFSCGGDSLCGRRNRHHPHTYVDPCQCAKGQAFLPKAQDETSELAAVGRSKPRQKSRFSSWTQG
jgi:hypothetical protein